MSLPQITMSHSTNLNLTNFFRDKYFALLLTFYLWTCQKHQYIFVVNSIQKRPINFPSFLFGIKKKLLCTNDFFARRVFRRYVQRIKKREFLLRILLELRGIIDWRSTCNQRDFFYKKHQSYFDCNLFYSYSLINRALQITWEIIFRNDNELFGCVTENEQLVVLVQLINSDHDPQVSLNFCCVSTKEMLMINTPQLEYKISFN